MNLYNHDYIHKNMEHINKWHYCIYVNMYPIDNHDTISYWMNVYACVLYVYYMCVLIFFMYGHIYILLYVTVYITAPHISIHNVPE